MKFLYRLLVSGLALAAFAQAQTTVTNQSGGCSTGIFCSLPLAGGIGNITLAAIVGPYCLLGQSCSFPSGYMGTSFAYQWPDGSSATAENFAGVMTYVGSSTCGANCSAYNYIVTGTFSGQDSKGQAFTGSTRQTITISHQSRGGNNTLDTGGATTLTFAPGSQTSPPPDFSLTAAPTNLTLQAGQSVVTTLTLAPAGGFSGTQNFTCSGLPASTSCSFNPPTLIGDGSNTPLATQMTINAASTKAMITPRRHAPPLRQMRVAYQVLALLVPCAFLCWENRKTRRTAHLSLFIALLLAAGIGAASCGGGASQTSSATLAQTPVSSPTVASSTVVVTAANSSGASHRVSINLVLMP